MAETGVSTPEGLYSRQATLNAAARPAGRL
jgi:hypothetical protein